MVNLQSFLSHVTQCDCSVTVFTLIQLLYQHTPHEPHHSTSSTRWGSSISSSSIMSWDMNNCINDCKYWMRRRSWQDLPRVTWKCRIENMKIAKMLPVPSVTSAQTAASTFRATWWNFIIMFQNQTPHCTRENVKFGEICGDVNKTIVQKSLGPKNFS